ncbi:uncharacterized protein METZ01_LOCUS152889 [marine metagenome]|uniref:Uncharacterized protein n=1 Tax=marine metagenome TaxID=408172 RepID=A0A382AEP1_9ZZZZ
MDLSSLSSDDQAPAFIANSTVVLARTAVDVMTMSGISSNSARYFPIRLAAFIPRFANGRS